MIRLPPRSTRFPYTTLSRSREQREPGDDRRQREREVDDGVHEPLAAELVADEDPGDERPRDGVDERDRKSTRLNSSHANISHAVFCLKKKKGILFFLHQATS